MTDVHAVILAGGGGTRLWPASRRRAPKQFLALASGGRSLLAATVERVRPLAPLARVLVVTVADQADAVRAAVPGLPEENLVIEPAARNTAPAIALAARALARRGAGDSVMAILPSDHLVADEAEFLRVLGQAVDAAREHLVTVGIPPTRPETGYGYLELGDHQSGPTQKVRRFVEKPDLVRAREYVAAGHYLWNSGMFFFRADRLLAETARHLPAVTQALEGRYQDAPSISIDYGIMERAADIRAVPGEFGWSDVGSWAELADLHPSDADDQVRLGGPLVAVDARRNLVVGDRLVALVGVSDLIVVSTDDAVLIVPRERAQEVRAVVAELGRRGLEAYL